MSQHHLAITTLLHASLQLDGLNKTEVTRAKRANIVANGDKPAIEAAAALHEKGIDASWLCPDSKLIPVDTLAKVEDLVKDGADVTELQKFSPSEILAGLNEAQLASLKPAPMVEEAVEAPVVETAPEAVVVKAEAPVAKVETPKPVEKFECMSSGEPTPATQLFVPPYWKVVLLLGKPSGSFLTEEDLKKHARRVMFTEYRNTLADALEVVRGESKKREKFDAKVAADAAQKEAWLTFCKELKPGQSGEYLGKQFRKCSFTGEVHKAELSRYPGIGEMKAETAITIKDKKVHVIPTLEAAIRRFTCGPRKQAQMGMTDENSMTLGQLETTIAQVLAEEKKERDLAQAKRERFERQQQGGNRNQQMSKADEAAGEREFRQNQDKWSGAKRDGRSEKGSRNDQARKDRDDFEKELAEG